MVGHILKPLEGRKCIYAKNPEIWLSTNCLYSLWENDIVWYYKDNGVFTELNNLIVYWLYKTYTKMI